MLALVRARVVEFSAIIMGCRKLLITTVVIISQCYTGVAIAAEPPFQPTQTRGELAQTSSVLAKWHKEPNQEILVNYRIVGSYRILQKRLAPLIRANMISWSAEFQGLGAVDIDSIFARSLKEYSELTGLRLVATRAVHAKRAADIIIDLYESDRPEDLRSFDGLKELSDRMSEQPQVSGGDYFIRSGWARLYSGNHQAVSAACLIVQSAFTFREALTVSTLRHHGIGPPKPSTLAWPPFVSHLRTDFQIRTASYFDSARALNQLEFINSPACRRRLVDAYAIQWRASIDDCLGTALGAPPSDVGPRELAAMYGGAPWYKSDFSYLPLGSKNWVLAQAAEVVAGHQDNPAYFQQVLESMRTLHAAYHSFPSLNLPYWRSIQARSGGADEFARACFRRP